MNRFRALTGIRAIAAIMVFLYHYRKFWRDALPAWSNRILNEFHTGVSLFFVLSGFLIAYTYTDKPMRSRGAYGQYLLIRLIRIFPIYLIILTLKYLSVGFPDASLTALTYTLTHGFSNQYNLHGVSQAWSLTVEMSFYLLAPLIYFGWNRNPSRTITSLLLLLGITIGAGYAVHAWIPNRYDFFYDWYFVLNTTFIGRFVEFLAGMMLAHWMRTHEAAPRPLVRHATLTGGLAVLLIIFVLGLFEKELHTHGIDTLPGLLIRNLVFPFAAACFLYGLASERTWLGWLMGSRVFVLLGNASFVFYLAHIGYVSNTLAKGFFLPDRNFIALWVLSILIYLLIEKPVYETLKRRIKREKPAIRIRSRSLLRSGSRLPR